MPTDHFILSSLFSWKYIYTFIYILHYFFLFFFYNYIFSPVLSPSSTVSLGLPDCVLTLFSDALIICCTTLLHKEARILSPIPFFMKMYKSRSVRGLRLKRDIAVRLNLTLHCNFFEVMARISGRYNKVYVNKTRTRIAMILRFSSVETLRTVDKALRVPHKKKISKGKGMIRKHAKSISDSHAKMSTHQIIAEIIQIMTETIADVLIFLLNLYQTGQATHRYLQADREYKESYTEALLLIKR